MTGFDTSSPATAAACSSVDTATDATTGQRTYVLQLEGVSRVETVVTMLTWLKIMADAATSGLRLPHSTPIAIEILPPASAQSNSGSAQHGGAHGFGDEARRLIAQQGAAADSAAAVHMAWQHMLPAIEMVLSAQCAELLGVTSSAEQRDIFVLRSPLAARMDAGGTSSGGAGTGHLVGGAGVRPPRIVLQAQELYRALGL